MDFQEAKKTLNEEETARHAQWDKEREERRLAGTPNDLDSIFDRFEAKFASAGWLVEQWWKVRRFFTRTFRDRTWYYNAKNRYLRGKRGWGSQDWWNLSDYVAETLPSALRHLAKESHGHPMSIYDVDGKDLTHEETSETPDTLRVHTLTLPISGSP